MSIHYCEDCETPLNIDNCSDSEPMNLCSQCEEDRKEVLEGGDQW